MKVRFGYDAALAYSRPRSSARAGFGALLHAVAAMPLNWVRRRYGRRDRMNLNEHLLRDMGLERSHAPLPAVRPYWRA